MQNLPTYSYKEFMQHILIADKDTAFILLELLCEEAHLYNRCQASLLYMNWMHVAQSKNIIPYRNHLL